MAGLAMKLTYARMFLIPLFVLCYYWAPGALGQWPAFFIYTLACLSDYLDGYWARKMCETSAFGAFLDPVADKLMVCTILLVLLHAHPEPWLLLATILLIGREIWISALREWMATLAMRDAVAVSSAGKWKTAIQMTALGLLILREPIGLIPIWRIGQALLLVATLLSLYSMVLYNHAAWRARARQDDDSDKRGLVS